MCSVLPILLRGRRGRQRSALAPSSSSAVCYCARNRNYVGAFSGMRIGVAKSNDDDSRMGRLRAGRLIRIWVVASLVQTPQGIAGSWIGPFRAALCALLRGVKLAVDVCDYRRHCTFWQALQWPSHTCCFNMCVLSGVHVAECLGPAGWALIMRRCATGVCWRLSWGRMVRMASPLRESRI